MNCEETRLCLSAHVDRELDARRDAEVVVHLERCADCADTARAQVAWRDLTRKRLRRHAAPSGLEAQIRASLRLPERTTPSRRQPWTWTGWALRIPACAAALALAVAIGYQLGADRAQTNMTRQAYVSGHVRALLTGHTIDVASSDRHTVKPWFAGKIDFSPTVRELSADGFPLLGGRLDRIDGRLVAVLVYQRRKHMIDLYVAPQETDVVPRDGREAGFNLVTWAQDGMRWVAVSDLAAEELQAFARRQQDQPRPDPR